MGEHTLNSARFDPYKAFMFRIKWDGRYVAGVSKMSALRRATDPVVHRKGGDPLHERMSHGEMKYEAVTFERGVSLDYEFETWANQVYSLSVLTLKNFRKDIVVDVFNEAGQLAISYRLLRCWPSEYAAWPALDAGTVGVTIELLKVELEGLECDAAATEPTEQ
jgi:phage tail-like protein